MSSTTNANAARPSPNRRIYDAILDHEPKHPPSAAEVAAALGDDERAVRERLAALDADPQAPVHKLPRQTGDVDRYTAVETRSGIEEEL